MKILLATSAAVPSGGGIAAYNQELVRLLGKDNDIFLLTHANEHNVKGYKGVISTYGNNLFSFSYCSIIVKWINQQGFDLIINSNSQQLAVIAPFVNSPILTVSHYVDNIFAAVASFNHEYIGRIITLSKYGKNYIEKEYKIKDSSKIVVLYNFVARKDLNTRDKSKDKCLTIVYPGGASIHKSPDMVLKSLIKLQRTDLNFTFIWIGDILTNLSSISLVGAKTIANFFKEDKRIKIRGKVSREQSINIIEKCNIFVLPSKGEGCPMTLLEAMRGGCIPVVSNAKHGSLEIVNHSKAGIVVQQGDSEELKNILEDIICNHQKYANFYYKSTKYLEDNLSQDNWNKQMMNYAYSCVSLKKKIIKFSRFNFMKSVIPFRILRGKYYLLALWEKILYRIKFDIIYLHRNK